MIFRAGASVPGAAPVTTPMRPGAMEAYRDLW
jgi:hypothetical protein